MKKTKLVSVLLAVVMILGLLPWGQVFAAPATYDIVYYVSETGNNSNDGLTATTPLKNIANAYAKIVAAAPTAQQTVAIYVDGVIEGATTSQQWITTGATARVPVTVDIIGVDDDATILFAYTDTASSIRKYLGAPDFCFRNLTILPKGNSDTANALATNNYIASIGVGIGHITFDDVVFADYDARDTAKAHKIRWRIYAEPWSSNVAFKNFEGYTKGQAYPVLSQVTFMNGDYTNLDDVAAKGIYAHTNMERTLGATITKTADGGFCDADIKQSASIVIGKGAKMGTVSALNWNAACVGASVTVAADVTSVKNLYVFGPSAISVDRELDVKVTVEDPSKVENLKTYADTCDYSGITSIEAVKSQILATGTLVAGTKTYINGVEQTTPGGQTPPPAPSYDIEYYVSASGDNANDGLTAATPKKGIGAAYKAIVASNPSADKKIAIHIMGSIQVTTNGSTNGFFGDIAFPDKTIPNVVDLVAYTGAGYEDSKTVLYFPITTVGNPSSRKTVAGNFCFKDLTIAPDLATDAENGVTSYSMIFSPSVVDIAFDNVVFSKTDYSNENIAVKWLVVADATTPTSYTNNAEYKALAGGGHIDHTPSITFRNGNYEHVEVAGAGTYLSVSGSDNVRNYSGQSEGVLKKASRVNAKKDTDNAATPTPTYSVSVEVIIEDGAKMGTVSAYDWDYAFSYANVTVKKGASVKNLYGAGPNALNFDNKMPVNILVEDGATVGKALCYADTVNYAGYKTLAGTAATKIDPAKHAKVTITLQINGKTYVNGALSAAPGTGDASMIALTVSVALISLVAVVVLKKKATRA